MAKKFSQKDKQERGAKGEGLVTASLSKQNIWNHKLVNAGYGTVFDKLVIPPGCGYAVEVKTRVRPSIEYSKIEQNERKGLEKFMMQVGRRHAFILGIWLVSNEVKRAFLIPWTDVREDVCSGRRGSINMLDFQELPRVGAGWDFSLMWKQRRNVVCAHQLDYWEEECSKCDGMKDCRKEVSHEELREL